MLLHEELTYQVRSCFFDVHNDVGVGLPERAYQRALALAFASRGIAAVSQPEFSIRFRGRIAALLRPDFIVENRVLIELKTTRTSFAPVHLTQLLSYLKGTGIRVGILANLGRKRVEDRRYVFDPAPFEMELVSEAFLKHAVRPIDRSETLILDAIIEVGRVFGLGYNDVIYRQILITAWESQNHHVNAHPMISPQFATEPLGDYSLDAIVVDERALCIITSLHNGISEIDFARALCYAKNLKLSIAIVANFGKKKMEIAAVPRT